MSTNIINSIPTTLTDLLVKLKILGMIERGKKINMGNMTFVNGSSWYGAFTRALAGEGRKGLMVHVNQIVAQSITAINEYQNTEFCKSIVNNLAEAKIGIQNLMTTYQDDPNIVAQIKVCVENIDIQLVKNRDLLEGHQVPINPPIINNQVLMRDQPPFGANGIIKNSPAVVQSPLILTPVNNTTTIPPDIY